MSLSIGASATSTTWFSDVGWLSSIPGGGANVSASTLTVGAASGAGGSVRTAGTAYWITVLDADVFTAHSIFRIVDVPTTGNDVEIQFKVLPNASGVFVDTALTNPRIRVTPITTTADVTNAVLGTGLKAQVFGTANAQGQTGADEGCYNVPASVGNAVQIFRDKYSFTNTAMKTSAKFDETGPYKDKAKEISIQHMLGMERQFLFGDYSKSDKCAAKCSMVCSYL